MARHLRLMPLTLLVISLVALLMLSTTYQPASANPAATVNIVDSAFVPQSITVLVGTTVTWNNTGSLTHTATSTSGPVSFDSGFISPGGSYQFTFDNVGTYNYICTIHGFTGILRVVSAEDNLSTGWNLVEFTAVDNVNDNPDNVFPGLTYLTDFTIFWYKVGAGYQLQASTAPFNDNTGYWVYVNTPAVVGTTGSRPASRNIILSTGWNMVGFPVDNSSTTPDNILPGLTYLSDFTIFWYKVGAGFQLQAATTPFKDNQGYFVNIDTTRTVTVP